MPKVDYKDLEDITKYLDKILKKARKQSSSFEQLRDYKQGLELSQRIKDKYTQIKPDYEG